MDKAGRNLGAGQQGNRHSALIVRFRRLGSGCRVCLGNLSISGFSVGLLDDRLNVMPKGGVRGPGSWVRNAFLNKRECALKVSEQAEGETGLTALHPL